MAISCQSDPVAIKPEFCAYLLVMHSHKEADRLFQALGSRITTFNSRLNSELTGLQETNSASNSPGDFPVVHSRKNANPEEGDDSPFIGKGDEGTQSTKSETDDLPTNVDSESSIPTPSTD